MIPAGKKSEATVRVVITTENGFIKLYEIKRGEAILKKAYLIC